MAWDSLSGVAKMAWDVLSGMTKTVWNILSIVANRCGMFCPGCQKMAWMFCSMMFCPTFLSHWYPGSGVVLGCIDS